MEKDPHLRRPPGKGAEPGLESKAESLGTELRSRWRSEAEAKPLDLVAALEQEFEEVLAFSSTSAVALTAAGLWDSSHTAVLAMRDGGVLTTVEQGPSEGDETRFGCTDTRKGAGGFPHLASFSVMCWLFLAPQLWQQLAHFCQADLGLGLAKSSTKWHLLEADI
nr:probable N-acetyltransferase 16 [Cavia porcellus]